MKKKSQFSVELADGGRVSFKIAARPNEQNYFVYFRDRQGRRLERSTKQDSQKRAFDSAIQIIKGEYAPRIVAEKLTWDEAAAAMEGEMKAKNLRPATIVDYKYMLSNLKKIFPSTRGPAELSPALAKLFKARRMADGLSPYTVAGNINKYSVIWSKWLIKECDLLDSNPWEGVEKPKVDEPEPRYIEPAEQQAFFDWLKTRWNGWRLPVLFFEVKAIVGRRLLQLASLPSSCLKDGRIVFCSESNKGRRMEHARVPVALYQELLDLAGPNYLWEKYTEQLKAANDTKGRRTRSKEFTPARLKRFLQGEIDAYNKENENTPGFVPFTAHNFRDTAMTKAWDAGIDLDRAAVAYGCNRETMKKHYIRKNALAIADQVFEKIFGESEKKGSHEEPRPTQPNDEN